MSDVAFEARLGRAARRYSDLAIRPVDAVEIATAAMRAGERQPTRHGASARGSRWLVLATTGIVLAGLLGWALLAGGGRGPTLVPSSSVAVPTLEPSRSPTQAAGGAPDPRSGTWLADLPPAIVFERTPGPTRVTLTVDSGLVARVGLVDEIDGLFPSSVLVFEVDKIRLTSSATVVDDATHLAGDAVTVDGARLEGCSEGDVGDYQIRESREGLLLTLTVLTEECPSRAAVIGRTWTRSLRVPNGGGVGVVDGFDPPFTVALPPGNYVVIRDPDSTTIGQEFPEFKFLSWKDPQGWNDPCDTAKGRYAIAPGPDAFVAYIRQLEGFTVDGTTEMEIDGHRTVRLDLRANSDASCASGGLNEWQPKAATGDLTWFLRPGDYETVFLVDYPGATVMFQILPIPDARGLAVLDSIRFLDQLPTAP